MGISGLIFLAIMIVAITDTIYTINEKLKSQRRQKNEKSTRK